MALTVSYGCWLSLTVCMVPRSFYTSLTVFHGCWMSLTVSPSNMELLHVVHCLSFLLTVSHSLHGVAACLSVSPMVAGSLSHSLRSHGVATCLSLLLAVSHCLSQCRGVAGCFSPSPMVAGCLSLSLRSYGFATCLLLYCYLSLSL